MTEPRKPKQAATVILLRPVEPKGFEVFLTRRPDGMPFLGGMYCYPGGTVSKEDCRAAMIARTVGRSPMQARQIIGAAFSPEEAIGLWIAAVREVFEEVGVLLAADATGAKMAMSSERTARLAVGHDELSANSELCRALGTRTALLRSRQLGLFLQLADAGAVRHALRHALLLGCDAAGPDAPANILRSRPQCLADAGPRHAAIQSQ